MPDRSRFGFSDGVAGLAVVALGAYLMTRSNTLTDEEQRAIGYGEGYRRVRRQGHRLPGVFLVACGVSAAMTPMPFG